MKKNCLLCFLLFFSCHSALAGESLDSLLNVLDKTIKEADTYVQIKENKLHELKKEARKTPPFSVERYNLNNDIYLHPTISDTVVQPHLRHVNATRRWRTQLPGSNHP